MSTEHPSDVDSAPAGKAGFISADIPASIRYAGFFGVVEGLVGLIVAVVFIVRDLTGHHTPGASGAGTALWFVLIFGAILAGGIALLKARAWGRGPILFFQLCLLGVAYYMFTSSRPELGIPTALIAALGLALIFHKDSVNWMAARYEAR